MSVTWVRQKRFCELTGETKDSLRNKRTGCRIKGRETPPVWIEGRHFVKTGSEYRYNLREFDKWVETHIPN